MRKALSLTALHNSLANVGNTPVGIGEGVGWYRRFVSTIQLLDAKERLASDIVGAKQLDVRSPSALREKLEINRRIEMIIRHTAKRATSSSAASQMAAEYNGLDRRDSTALNLSATSIALAIEVGRVGAQAGAIK
jgi:hypothetical protein